MCPYCAISCHAVPYRAISYHTPVLCHIMLYSYIFFHIVPYCAILCRIVPYCATSGNCSGRRRSGKRHWKRLQRYGRRMSSWRLRTTSQLQLQAQTLLARERSKLQWLRSLREMRALSAAAVPAALRWHLPAGSSKRYCHTISIQATPCKWCSTTKQWMP